AVKAADKAGVITLEPDSVRYQVKGLDVSAGFAKPSAEPQIPEGSGSVQTIAIGAELWEAIAEASLCASTDEARYILNGVHLGRERVAATDGRRLYMHTLPSPLPFDEEGIILPLHPLYRLFSNVGEALLNLGAVPKEEGLSR